MLIAIDPTTALEQPSTGPFSNISPIAAVSAPDASRVRPSRSPSSSCSLQMLLTIPFTAASIVGLLSARYSRRVSLMVVGLWGREEELVGSVTATPAQTLPVPRV